MKKLILVLGLIGLSACGSGGGGGGSSSTTALAVNKSVFSKWTSSTDGTFIDLTGDQFGQESSLTSVFTGGAQCVCEFEAQGTETSGTYSITNCSYTGGGTANPGCGSMNTIGSYTKPASQLTACSGAGGTNCTLYN